MGVPVLPAPALPLTCYLLWDLKRRNLNLNHLRIVLARFLKNRDLRGLSVWGRQLGSSGKFKKSWNIPFLVPSTKGEKFTYCRLCSRDVSVAHGGLNDAKRHCESAGHQKKYSECQSNTSIITYLGETSLSHSSKVLSAKVMMAQFIALHNLPFQAADHLTELCFQTLELQPICLLSIPKLKPLSVMLLNLALKNQLLIC